MSVFFLRQVEGELIVYSQVIITGSVVPWIRSVMICSVTLLTLITNQTLGFTVTLPGFSVTVIGVTFTLTFLTFASVHWGSPVAFLAVLTVGPSSEILTVITGTRVSSTFSVSITLT